MIRLLDKTKISFFNYFFFFCIVIYAGKATEFSRDLGDIRTIGNAFALIMTVAFILKNRITFTGNYAKAILVFLIYSVATSINNGMINPLWMSQWIIWLTIAYALCQGFQSKMFVVFETILFHLSIVGLVLWLIQIVSPGFVTQLVKTFEFSKPYAEDDNVLANMIVYTLVNADYGNADFSLLIRNAGFTWEPGAFASMICLGIFCNSLRTNFKLRKNYSLWVFFAALFSTQSTTGFMIFLVMLAIWMILNREFILMPIAVPLFIALFEMSFVRDKMMNEYEGLQTADYSRATSGSFGRMYSFQLDFEEFLRHPILGLGGYQNGTWYKLQGYDFSTISGIGHLLAYYGAIMTIVFFAMLFKSCKRIKDLFNSSNAYLLLVAMVGMMISYSLWTHPLYIAFWMFGLFGPALKPKGKNIIQTVR